MEWVREDIMVSLSYIAIALCIMFPPSEFISAGLTVQTIYGNYLGSEQIDFVNYHIRRTAATICVHGVMPLGYFLCLFIFTSNDIHGFYQMLFVSTDGHVAWPGVLVLGFSIGLFVWTLLLARKWLHGGHPIIKQLKQYNSENWERVAAEIVSELLRIDKFETGSANRRLIVTESWIILTSTYGVKLAKKAEVRLRLKAALELGAHPDLGQHGTQLLDIEVLDSTFRDEPVLFSVRLSSLEFNELQSRVQTPIENVREIVIKQSLSDQFVAAFLEQININPRYRITEADRHDIENCIGCMQKPADVKLYKLCQDDPPEIHSDQPLCQQCFCRPMWCSECLGRWFAARQAQSDPSTWMAHKCPCPTCRATFCVLDICKLDA